MAVVERDDGVLHPHSIGALHLPRSTNTQEGDYLGANLAWKGMGYIVPHFAGWLKSIMGRGKPLFRHLYEAQRPISATWMSQT